MTVTNLKTETYQQEKIDLAAALRLAARFDLHEGIANHFSFAVDEDGERFLVNPHGIHWSQLRASDILVANRHGEVLDGNGEAERSAICIHGQVHYLHPRARCVLHTHMPYATALTAIEDGRLEPVVQSALMFYDEVAYDDEYGGLAFSEDEGQRIADALGDKRVLFMANHGVMVVGKTIAQAFCDLYFLERACRVQVLAMSTGRPLKLVGHNRAASTFEPDWRDESVYGETHFAALKRVLDAEDPSYAA